MYASVILRTEILSCLYTASAPHDLAHAALASFSFITFVPVSQLIADRVAELIASNGARLKNIDALHLATATQVGASEFWTNDFTLAKVTVPGLTIKPLADG